MLDVPAGREKLSSEASFRLEPCLVYSRHPICFVDTSVAFAAAILAHVSWN